MRAHHTLQAAALALLFVLFAPRAARAREFPPSFSVATYGARPNTSELQTVAIQKAIDAAAQTASSGTGAASAFVYFPPGTYLTGSLFVKSGVTLRVGKGVTLLGSQDIADYPVLPTRIAGIEMSWPAALVNIYNQSNASIEGDGTIDGDGKIFWDSYWTLRKAYEPRGLRWASDYDARRPRLIQVFNSNHVTLGHGLLLRRSGFWTVHICYSHDITIENVTIRNNEDGHGPSTDGIDIDSSSRVLVDNADIAVNDDALCLKAGRDSDGLRVDRPTEDIILRNSIVRSGAAGVTIGSETSGGFRNIEAYGITVLAPVPVGILFKSAHTRGGWAENIRLHDFDLHDVAVALRVTMNWNPSYSYAAIPPSERNYPPYWTVLATPVPEAQGQAHFHDIHIFNIKGTAKTLFEVDAFPRVPLERFELDHLALRAEHPGHIADTKSWRFHDDTLTSADGAPVELINDFDLTGLLNSRVVAHPAAKPDPSKQSFAEQDKK